MVLIVSNYKLELYFWTHLYSPLSALVWLEVQLKIGEQVP